MRNKRLTKRLLLYFSVTLILFALIMGSVFSWLFTHYNQHVHEEETMQRVLTLAAAIPANCQHQLTMCCSRCWPGRQR